jgi:hypothetical protein
VGEMEDWRKVGACCGVGFVILFIIGIIIQGDIPLPTDSAADIRDYFSDGNKYMIGDFFTALAFVFFLLPFASALTAYMREREGQPVIWSPVIFGGALILVAAGGAISGMQGSLAYTDAKGASDELLKSFVTVSYYTWTIVVAFATSLIVFCASMLMVRKKVFWSWLAPLGFLLVIVALISFFGVLKEDPDGGLAILSWIAFIGFGVWVLLVSAALWTAKEPA